MTIKRPTSMQTGHRTKKEIAIIANGEAALTPDGDVFAVSPTNLDGHRVALKVWERLAQLYKSMDAQVVCELDLDLLVDYCLLTEQVTELDKVRAKVLKRRYGGVDDLTKIDARVDRKRAQLQQMRRTLYLTPLARAGVVPGSKAKEPERDPLEDLLDGVDM